MESSFVSSAEADEAEFWKNVRIVTVISPISMKRNDSTGGLWILAQRRYFLSGIVSGV